MIRLIYQRFSIQALITAFIFSGSFFCSKKRDLKLEIRIRADKVSFECGFERECFARGFKGCVDWIAVWEGVGGGSGAMEQKEWDFMAAAITKLRLDSAL